MLVIDDNLVFVAVVCVFSGFAKIMAVCALSGFANEVLKLVL